MPRFLIGTLLFSFFLSSCSKSKVKTYDFRFAIETTSPVITPGAYMTMTMGPLVVEHGTFASGTTWSHTRIMETGLRPIEVYFNSGTIYLSGAGSATFHIYVNGKEKATKTVSSVLQGSDHFISPSVSSYSVQ